MHSNKKPRNATDGSIAPFANKYLVMGFRDGDGNVIAFPMTEMGAAAMKRYVQENVEPGSTIYTDAHIGYQGLDKLGYNHAWVNHSVGEFVNEMAATTNGIESFWSLLKRGYVGTFHYMSPEHLHRYVSEFSFRHTMGHGNGFGIMAEVLRNSVNQRLTWDDLVAQNPAKLPLSNTAWEGIETEIVDVIQTPGYYGELC